MREEFKNVVKIIEQFRELNPLEMQIAVCMMIDTTAKKQGTTSLDLMDDIRPVIEEVNSKMGFEGI